MILYHRAVDVDFFLPADPFFSLDCRTCFLLNWISLGELNLSIILLLFLSIRHVSGWSSNQWYLYKVRVQPQFFTCGMVPDIFSYFYNVNSKYAKKHAMHVWTICVMWIHTCGWKLLVKGNPIKVLVVNTLCSPCLLANSY